MPLGVGVIGAGTVGGGVIELLQANAPEIAERSQLDVALVHVADKSAVQLEGLPLEGVRVSNDAAELIGDPAVDVVCELIGGLEPARTFILDALAAKKHVVTANKMLLAHHGPELCRAAIGNGVELRYEAAVGGGIPIIKSLREGLAGNRIERVYGILNGTCNYILTRMNEEGLEFGPVLEEAVANGFAEDPPDLDIEGHDTAHKAHIIASLCYSTELDPDAIYIEGITQITHADVAYAKEMGHVIKLLAIVQCNGGAIDVRVHPTLVPVTHLIASVRREFNAIFVQSDMADATLYYGRGAGRFPTASAVVSDVVDIARRGDGAPPPPFVYKSKREVADIGSIHGRYYLRLTTMDRVGVLGNVCTALGAHGVSIASCIQKEDHQDNEPVHVVLLTHETRESDLRAALEEIESYEFIREKTMVMRVL